MRDQDITEIIKQYIREKLHKAYTEYKEDYLNKLNEEMESKRNTIIGDALNGISIAITDNNPYNLEPCINVVMKINKNIYLKKE